MTRIFLVLFCFFATACTSMATHPLMAHGLQDEAGQEQPFDNSPETLSRMQEIANMGFVEPDFSRVKTLSDVSAQGVPSDLYSRAVAYFNANRSRIRNQRYITIVNFKKFSGEARMFIIDMSNGSVESIHVAHGNGSDPGNTGFATQFSNVPNSQASSVGFYLTAESFNFAGHGIALRLDGLSGTNSNARARGILFHGSGYVFDSDVKAGRSAGCLAISFAKRDRLVHALGGGSLIYADVSAE